MIWLILSILLNTYVGIIFKFFHKFDISNLQGIVINYFICVITGIIFLGFVPFNNFYLHQTYLPFAVVQGLFFLIVFVLISKSTIINGVSTTQVANKLSLVIPVLFAHFLFKDSIGILKFIGILLSGIAVYLTSKKNNSNFQKNNYTNILLPIFIFIGSGLLDTYTSYVQKKYFKLPEDENVYIIFCFTSAFIFDIIYLTHQLFSKQEKWQNKSIIGGTLLGIPNYFSIYTFIFALKINVFHTSAVVPVNNIGVVFLSTIIAILFFKEKINKQNILGLAFALIAIILIIIGD